jgi:hypothetical protein
MFGGFNCYFELTAIQLDYNRIMFYHGLAKNTMQKYIKSRIERS